MPDAKPCESRLMRLIEGGEQRAPAMPGRPDPPAPPDWLPAAAKVEWARLAPLITPWQEKFADLLGVYCCELATFKADPASFHAARVAQLRLCAVTLRLVPDIGQR